MTEDEKQVMYCLGIQNCEEIKRMYFCASESLINAIKTRVDEFSDGCHRATFPHYSGTDVYYNPDWEDSLEFRARSREAAVLTAKIMGFGGLFLEGKK